MNLHDAYDINFRLLLMCCMGCLILFASNSQSTKNAEKLRERKRGGLPSKRPNGKRCASVKTRRHGKSKKSAPLPWYVAPPLTVTEHAENALYEWKRNQYWSKNKRA